MKTRIRAAKRTKESKRLTLRDRLSQLTTTGRANSWARPVPN